MEFYLAPPHYRSFAHKCHSLCHCYPQIKLFSIGKSVLGRKIYALGLGNLKNATLFAAATHGSEWLTTSLVLRFVEQLSSHWAQKTLFLGCDIGALLCQKGLIAIPMVNPDGVQIALHGAQGALHRQKQVQQMLDRSDNVWQANANGVDLNHNFDAGFEQLRALERQSGYDHPGPTRYGGPCAHSEPETRALVKVTTLLNPSRVVSFHSQGEEIFYQYGAHTPKSSQIIAQTIAQSSGYKLVEAQGLNSHGGYKDWFIDKFHRPGFTIEIGRGQNPLPIRDLNPIYARLCEAMLILTML